MEQMREVLSKGSPIEQIQSELTILSKEERQSLLKLTMENDCTVAIPAEEILAMKADLSITWNKLRVLRRYTHF